VLNPRPYGRRLAGEIRRERRRCVPAGRVIACTGTQLLRKGPGPMAVAGTLLLPSIDEGARRRFEAACRAGRPEPIAQFLPPPDHPLYRPTLEELVFIDLEFAWKAGPNGPPRRVEDYVAQFP